MSEGAIPDRGPPEPQHHPREADDREECQAEDPEGLEEQAFGDLEVFCERHPELSVPHDELLGALSDDDPRQGRQRPRRRRHESPENERFLGCAMHHAFEGRPQVPVHARTGQEYGEDERDRRGVGDLDLIRSAGRQAHGPTFSIVEASSTTVSFSTAPFDMTTTASSNRGWSNARCTLRTRTDSAWGPTTTAACARPR